MSKGKIRKAQIPVYIVTLNENYSQMGIILIERL